MRGYLAAIGLALMLVVAGLSYTQGKAVGKTQCLAERSIAADKAQTAIDLRDQSSATARVDMLDYLASIPAIEVQANESAERVRTIYKTVVGRCVPVRPASVQSEIDAAYRAATDSVSAVQRTSAPASARSAKP